MTISLLKTMKLLPFAMLAVTALEPAAAWPVEGGAPSAERVETRVVYGDLDLTSPAGQATFVQRIKTGVRKVCSPSTTELVAMSQASRCRQDAFDGAMNQQRQIIANAENQRRQQLAAR
ncbi:hypothetical protein GCM10011529_06480 [Polymorphobacter glacialis]|uniref:UrcA family protein n=2 Tax=Sandarakinorhabdus glacialis TaxID=1614636 RepID=A0A917E4G3_9SPHN|nr:hypothetical protein GCM10011529_06480 [Polymorphobacter glacialis]